MMKVEKKYIIIFLLFIPYILAGKNIFNIKDYKANDKPGYYTMQIQKTIDMCNAAGGGIVLLPPGDYLSSTIILKDNTTLYLMPGARLIASNKEEDYTNKASLEDTGGGGVPMLVYAKGAKNISIRGEGQIVGQPEYYTEQFGYSSFIAEDCDAAIEAGIPLIASRWKKPNVSLVFLSECENVKIEGITLKDSPFWTLHLHWCNNVFIRCIYIYSKLNVAANSDGIDIDGSSNVSVSDCIIETGDDAICLKTTKSPEGYRNCENVVVTNCILTSSSCALKLGTESYGDFRYVTFSNCIIRNSNRGLGIFIRDGGIAENITFSNINIECNRKPVGWWGSADAFCFVVLKRNENSKTGKIRRLVVKDITADCRGSNRIAGFNSVNDIEEMQISNVRLSISSEDTPDRRTKEGFSVRNASDVTITGLVIDWNRKQAGDKWANSIIFDNLEQLRAQDITVRNQPDGFSPLNIKNVSSSDIQEVKEVTKKSAL